MADVPERASFKSWDMAGAAFSMMITRQSYGDLYKFSAMAGYERRMGQSGEEWFKQVGPKIEAAAPGK